MCRGHRGRVGGAKLEGRESDWHGLPRNAPIATEVYSMAVQSRRIDKDEAERDRLENEARSIRQRNPRLQLLMSNNCTGSTT